MCLKECEQNKTSEAALAAVKATAEMLMYASSTLAFYATGGNDGGVMASETLAEMMRASEGLHARTTGALTKSESN
jgi:hypothetical protein